MKTGKRTKYFSGTKCVANIRRKNIKIMKISTINSSDGNILRGKFSQKPLLPRRSISRAQISDFASTIVLNTSEYFANCVSFLQLFEPFIRRTACDLPDVRLGKFFDLVKFDVLRFGEMTFP